MKKRIAAVFMLLALFVAMIPTSFAATTETAQSAVLRDLSSMTFDGERFDIKDYPVKTTDTGVYCIAVDEVGFRKDGALSNYGFYLYLYNPSGQAFSFTSSSNTVQMAVAHNEDGTPAEYEKFKIKLISVSGDQGYENVFMKYLVVDRASDYNGTTLKTRLLESKNRREYDISGFELVTSEGEIKDFAHGCNVIVRGYDAGCGDGNAESTKNITYIAQQTLSLDVHQAFWRTESSSKGVNHKHQVNSAYFSVPKEVWDQYKSLYSIKCVWEEHNTTPMIVTDDQDLYDILMSVRTVPVYSMEGLPSLYSNLKGPFTVMRPIVSGATGSTLYTYTTCNYAFNHQVRSETINLEIQNRLAMLGWIFKASDMIQLNEDSVTAQEILNYYETYGGYSVKDNRLFTDTVDEGREKFRNGMTIYFDELTEGAFDLSNYDSNHGWLQKLIDYNIFNGGLTLKGFTVDTSEVYPNFKPIDTIEPGTDEGENFISNQYASRDIADKYFLNDVDQAIAFRDFTKKALSNNEVVVLFRYASTDYFSESLTVYPEIEGHAYISTQTFFKDFDVIQLQFKAEDMSIATVPVVSDPTDGVGGLTGPTTSPDSDLVEDQWKKDWEEMMKSLLADLGQLFKWLILVVGVCALIPFVLKLIESLLAGFSGGLGGNSGGRRRSNRKRQRSKNNNHRPF